MAAEARAVDSDNNLYNLKLETQHIRKKSEKHPFVILSDSEESDIIEILRRSTPQNDTARIFYESIKLEN